MQKIVGKHITDNGDVIYLPSGLTCKICGSNTTNGTLLPEELWLSDLKTLTPAILEAFYAEGVMKIVQDMPKE